jgi:hypothetical protein
MSQTQPTETPTTLQAAKSSPAFAWLSNIIGANEATSFLVQAWFAGFKLVPLADNEKPKLKVSGAKKLIVP